MRGIFEKVAYTGDRNRWVEYLPFVVGHLRTMNMAALGGRSPMEVVTGLKPKLPQTLLLPNYLNTNLSLIVL